jgi:hypothetical protein
MPDPSHYSAIGWIVVAIAALCVAANQVDDWFKRRQGRDADRTVGPQPFIVAAEKQFALKAEFKEHADWDIAEHNNLHRKIGGVERGAAAALKADVDGLREEVTELGKQVAGLSASTDMQNQQLASIVATQTQILQRLPRRGES